MSGQNFSKSASPIAFAEHPHFCNEQSMFQVGGRSMVLSRPLEMPFLQSLSDERSFRHEVVSRQILEYRYPNR
jgi:hypothetical protein